jgi:hypothetical protein
VLLTQHRTPRDSNSEGVFIRHERVAKSTHPYSSHVRRLMSDAGSRIASAHPPHALLD